MYSEDLSRAYGAQSDQLMPVGLHRPSVTERVKNDIADMERKLAGKKELLDLLERNPDFERIFTLMTL